MEEKLQPAWHTESSSKQHGGEQKQHNFSDAESEKNEWQEFGGRGRYKQRHGLWTWGETRQLKLCCFCSPLCCLEELLWQEKELPHATKASSILILSVIVSNRIGIMGYALCFVLLASEDSTCPF